MRYHLDLARRMGDFLAEQGVFWYEEPFAPENIDDFVAHCEGQWGCHWLRERMSSVCKVSGS